ncbi:putative damage-inducible protein DinB [Paenibacillus endophyticus]|uniref:Putative damage-inducible protein DinB n=1 Tax=Paenibacillus endophyticus TaxID=1294268 RepID=A0A7W5GBD6_9BACL|nr:DinB family protein [Paenibacillus endophyticus]MBB3152847.1 putative damage-inducible protein DinB [Paenibacillus endophyticus]
MYGTVEDLIMEWKREAVLTQKVLDSLTDEALLQQVYPEGRTLGRIAWHFVTNIPDYLTDFGVSVAKVPNPSEVPAAKEITEAFQTISSQVTNALQEQWTDDTLKQNQKAFGRIESNATIFMGLIKHIVHHRGQVTVLMRQAGLLIPAVYGPSKEGWAQLGVTPPL